MARPRFERPLSALEVADALGVSVYTVRRDMRGGKIPYIQIGRSVRVQASVVRRILAESFRPATTDYKMAAAADRD